MIVEHPASPKMVCGVRVDLGRRIAKPAAVLAALAEFSTPDTLAMIDRQVDEAYRASLEQGDPGPLRKALDYWWFVVLVNRGDAQPPLVADGRGQLGAAMARRGVTG